MPAETYRRIDLALEQLDAAILLFLGDRKFAAVVTLAGAAELVLGQELTRRGRQAALEHKIDQYDVVHTLMHGKPLDRRAFRDAENRVRNALKHFDERDDAEIVVDLEEAAYMMLVRACENALKLDLDVPRFDAFNEWFYENIVGG